MNRFLTIGILLLAALLLWPHALSGQESIAQRESMRMEVNKLLNEFELRSQLTQDYTTLSTGYVQQLRNLFDENAQVFVDVVPSNSFRQIKHIDKYLKEAQKWYNQGYTVLNISDIILGELAELDQQAPYAYRIELGFVKSTQVLDAAKDIHFAEERYYMILGLDENFSNLKILTIDKRQYPGTNMLLQRVLFPEKKTSELQVPQPFKNLKVQRRGLHGGFDAGAGLAEISMQWPDDPSAYSPASERLIGFHANLHLDYYFTNWLGISAGIQYLRNGARILQQADVNDVYFYEDGDLFDVAERKVEVMSGEERLHLHGFQVPLHLSLKGHFGSGRLGILFKPGISYHVWALSRARVSGAFKTSNTYEKYAGQVLDFIETPLNANEEWFNTRYGVIEADWNKAHTAGYEWPEKSINLDVALFLLLDVGIDNYLLIGPKFNMALNELRGSKAEDYHIIDEQGNYVSPLAGAETFYNKYLGLSVGYFVKF